MSSKPDTPPTQPCGLSRPNSRRSARYTPAGILYRAHSLASLQNMMDPASGLGTC